MKINGPSSPPIRNIQSKKAERKQKPSLKKPKIDSELKVSSTPSLEDEQQHLVAKYVEEIASKKFGKYKDSSMLATAIQVVTSKLKHNKDALKLIKKSSKQRK